MLLVLAAVLLTAVLLSVATAILLSTMLLLSASVLSRVPAIAGRLGWRRHVIDASALEVHEHASFVFFGAVLQTEFATHLLHARFDLLHMVPAVVSLAYNDVEVSFTPLSPSFDALL